MPLGRDAAVAVSRLAGRLGLTVEETAAGIVRINNMHVATVIRQQTIERGLDPRDFVLYAFGGAGPVRVRVRGRVRGPRGRDPARQRSVHALGVRDRVRRCGAVPRA
jgi:hypothetical protein